MEWLPLGWRDIILLLVVLAAIYLVFVLFKLIQVGRRVPARDLPIEPEGSVPSQTDMREEAPAPYIAMEPVVAPPRALAAYEEAAAPESFAVPPAPTFEWDEVRDLFGDAAEDAATVSAASNTQFSPAMPHAPLRESGFGEPLADHLARSDMEMEIQRMRDEMQQMRGELEQLRASRRVSPQYSEAMELAQRGLSAQEVADRLGISLAEAELVHALSHGREKFE